MQGHGFLCIVVAIRPSTNGNENFVSRGSEIITVAMSSGRVEPSVKQAEGSFRSSTFGLMMIYYDTIDMSFSSVYCC